MEIRLVEKEGLMLDDARKLFAEYAQELDENLCFQSFEDELLDPLKKYGAPKGCLLVAYNNEQAIGCIALQPLHEEGVCEMKRLYVHPDFRSSGIGKALVQELLNVAKEKQYKKMVLDTLERLQPAIKLYLQKGFVITSAYYANPLSNVVYMEKQL